MIVAQIILTVALAYSACGLLLAVPFVTFGVGRLDEAARGAPLGFRLLILPGAVALWPLIAVRWLRAGGTEGRP
jgi:hypothetical protein